MPVKTKAPDRFPNRNRKPRKPRKPRGRALAAAAEYLLTNPTAALIDKHTGKPDGERIIEALSVLATGTGEQVAKFFGGYYRLRARDRQAALNVLEQRRFGRVPQIDEVPSEHRPTTIVNVFTTSEEFAFVTAQQPKLVGSTRALPTGEPDDRDG
jgi:hypothetical protein